MANKGPVLDCSMTTAWLLPDEVTPQTETVLERVQKDGANVPVMWPQEVANVMLISERRGRIMQEQSESFIVLLDSLPIVVDDRTPTLAFSAILPLARAQKLTVYDAAYLELALRLGLPLATLDKELRVAAQTLGVTLL